MNNRATAMYVLASTDAFTSGSGLLSEGLADGSVVTIPLLGEDLGPPGLDPHPQQPALSA